MKRPKSQSLPVWAGMIVLMLVLAACGGETDTTTVEQEEPDAAEPAADGVTGSGTIAFSFGAEQAEIYPILARPARRQAELRGYTFLEGAAFGDCDKQVQDLEGFIAQQVDAIIFLPACGPEPYDGVVEQAAQAGIPIMAYFNPVDGTDGALLTDNIEAGTLIGEEIVRWYNEDFTGDKDEFSWAMSTNDPFPAVKDRTDTVRDIVFEATGVEPRTFAGIEIEAGLEGVETILQADPGLNVFIGANDAAALGGYQALVSHMQESGRDPGEFFVAGMDGQNEALELLAEGGGEGGLYRASAALILDDLSRNIANLPIDVVEGKSPPSRVQNYVLLTPADAARITEILATYEAFLADD